MVGDSSDPCCNQSQQTILVLNSEILVGMIIILIYVLGHIYDTHIKACCTGYKILNLSTRLIYVSSTIK